MYLEDVSNRSGDLEFPDSRVKYLRGEIGFPPGGFPKLLQSKLLKSRNLDMMEGRPMAELGEYNFYKAIEELSSKYVLSKISNNYFPVNWKDYKAVYRDVAHHLLINIFLNSIK